MLYHVLILYFLIEFIRAIPWVARAIDRGKKPWSCHACLVTWVGLLSLPLLYGIHGVPWKPWLATLGAAHFLLRASWALRALAQREQWVEDTGHEKQTN